RRRTGGRADEGGNNHLWVAGSKGVHGGNITRRVDGRGESLVEEARDDVLNGGVKILGVVHSERGVGGDLGVVPTGCGCGRLLLALTLQGAMGREVLQPSGAGLTPVARKTVSRG